MVLNGYTILSLFFCLLRLLLSLGVIVVGWSAWRMSRRTLPPDQRELVENRSYLLFLTATVLMGINVASWPILYLLLQSYVQEWPSVMCIYGVTRIGVGTVGASRFLPGLVTGLQWTKPLLVFLSGAGYVLYVLNRRAPNAPIQQRVVVVLLLIGVGTLVDAVVEGAYLVIPKTEIRLDGGCCTASADIAAETSKLTPRIRFSEGQRPYLITAYFSLNLAMIGGLFAYAVFSSRPTIGRWRWTLLLGGLCSIPVSLLYLIEIAAPTILGLPFHHCAYDLISAAPESVLAVALFLLGCFSVGWAGVASRFGRSSQTADLLPKFISRLLFLGLFGYAGSVLIMALEMVLA